MSPPAELPVPPLEIARRVGPVEPEDPVGSYLAMGAALRGSIEDLLGPGWSWEGKSVLEFGSGAGRLLRHFAPEARAGASFTGCDVDTEAIEWASRHLAPPFRFVPNREMPPLPFGDGEFDLVIAPSVFTHIVEGWSDWLLELRRVVSPEGTVIATFLGEGADGLLEEMGGGPYGEDRFGMNVFGRADLYETINVVHSEWWLRARWGRAFEIAELRPSGFGSVPGHGQGVAVMHPRRGELTPGDLERPEPEEPREYAALEHNVRQLFAPAVQRPVSEAEALAGEAEHLRWQLDVVKRSRSWRLTKPVRWLGRVIRRIARRGA